MARMPCREPEARPREARLGIDQAASRAAVSNEQGAYAIPFLPPGIYTATYSNPNDMDAYSVRLDHYCPTSYNRFGPRVGLAYQLLQKPERELVVRGGWGLFYDLQSTPFGGGSWPYSYSRTVTGTLVSVPLPEGYVQKQRRRLMALAGEALGPGEIREVLAMRLARAARRKAAEKFSRGAETK